MQARIAGCGSPVVIKPRIECSKLESIPEMTNCDASPDLTWTPSPSPNTSGSGSPVVAVRSRSLPSQGINGVMSGLTAAAGTQSSGGGGAGGSPRSGSDREIKILVLGYCGVGKSALIVRYLTKRFIGDYASYETMCTAETAVDYKKVRLSILDMSWKCNAHDNLDRYLAWCDGALFLVSLVDSDSYNEIDRVCATFDNRIRRLPSVIVATKSDLVCARQVSPRDIQALANRMKCPYVETSAREDQASCAHAFVTLIQEAHKAKGKHKSRRNASKNGYPSKLQNIRDRLRSIAGEFRQRTNTF